MKTEPHASLRRQAVETDGGQNTPDDTRLMERPSWRLIIDYLVLKALSPVNATLAAHWVNRRFWFHPQRLPSHPRESEYLKSARRFALECAGRQLATYSWGEGVPVLLVHGWNGRGTQ